MSTSLKPVLASASGGSIEADFDVKPAARPLHIIRNRTDGWGIDLALWWRYRSMVLLLVWRDFKVKYKQSMLGGLWIVLQPLCSVLMFTFIFGRLAKMPSDGVRYELFNYVGIVPWALFSASLPAIAASLVANANLIQKVHFPRIMLPIYALVSSLIDFGILFAIQLFILACFGIIPTINVLFVPFLILWTLVLSFATGLLLATLNVKYRDVGAGIGFLVQIWFYATPVAYPTSALSPKLQMIAALNPMSWIVNSFRWALLGTNSGPSLEMLLPLVGTLTLLGFSYWIFRRAETQFVDVI